MELAEVLTNAGNWSVVQLPGRRFPGVVVQGDSLHTIVEDLVRARVALRDGDVEAAEDELVEVLEQLTDVMARYESALGERGIALPYVR